MTKITLIFLFLSLPNIKSLENTVLKDGSENVRIKVMPSKHIKVGKVVMNQILQSIRDAVDLAVDKFWNFHRIEPFEANIDMPPFPESKFLRGTMGPEFQQLRSSSKNHISRKNFQKEDQNVLSADTEDALNEILNSLKLMYQKSSE